jgi:hypothetical protein
VPLQPNDPVEPTVFPPVPVSAVLKQLAYLTAPSTLPHAFSRRNTIALRLFSLDHGIWLHQTDDVHGRIGPVLVSIGMLSYLVLFGVIERLWSIAACLCFIATRPNIVMHYNFELLRLVVREFDFLYFLLYFLICWLLLMPDLCGWDARTLIFVGCACLCMCGLLSVDTLPTFESLSMCHRGWAASIVGIVFLALAVWNDWLHGLHPRVVDIGLTHVDTKTTFLTFVTTVIVFGLRFLLAAVRTPHCMSIRRTMLGRPELFPHKISDTHRYNSKGSSGAGGSLQAVSH